MHHYAAALKKHLEQNADRAQAGPMRSYMRDQFEYLGIKAPMMKTLTRSFVAVNGSPRVSELDQIIRDLWSLPQREYQYAAVDLLSRAQKRIPATFIKTIEHMLITKSWWDTVDAISTRPLGVHFQRYPAVRDKYLARWRTSHNFWLRRAAILFQLNYKAETDFDLLRDIIRENLGSEEFFINKAIGWALRQYARTAPEAVRRFVNSTELNPLSRREAMKHLE